MSVLDEELRRLLANATAHHVTESAKATAWAIVRGIPFVGETLVDHHEGHWVSLDYAGAIALHIALEVDGEIDFDFDRGQRPNRHMLSLVAVRTGSILFSVMTPAHKGHGVIPREDGAVSRLAELFRQFIDG